MQTGCRKRQVGFRRECRAGFAELEGRPGRVYGVQVGRALAAGADRASGEGESPADTNSDREQWLSLLSFVLVEGSRAGTRLVSRGSRFSFNTHVAFPRFDKFQPRVRGQFPISGGNANRERELPCADNQGV